MGADHALRGARGAHGARGPALARRRGGGFVAPASAAPRRPGPSKAAPTLGCWMATVGIIGAGYVGLPLAVAFAEEGCEVIAVDGDSRKVGAVARGDCCVEAGASWG